MTGRGHPTQPCTCGHFVVMHTASADACTQCACAAVNIPIFVFGSNLAGMHGRGSAAHARRFYGAIQRVGSGPQGWSYAIPTKDALLRVMSLDRIRPYVLEFLDYARQHTDLTFDVVEIGCGLAGYRPADIAPMFAGFPTNVNLPVAFRTCLYPLVS
jgi:hypothetical protein